MKIGGYRKVHNHNSTFQCYKKINNSAEKGFKYGTNYIIILQKKPLINYFKI